MNRGVWAWMMGAFWLLASPIIHALPVTATGSFQDHTITLMADFSAGDPKQPAVLILHGFLTTKNFSTVQAISQTARDMGLAVLTPNLSYGYPSRQTPLKCTSIHRHRLQDDAQEVDFWLRWLKHKGYDRAILIGHSSASALLVHYLSTHTTPPVNIAGVVLTSLFYLSGPETGTNRAELARARQAVASHDTTPTNWHYLFCHGNYLATPESYLSYQIITRTYLIRHLRQVTARWPTYIIMGGADSRYRQTGRKLLDEYRHSGAHLIVIDEANHFFSREHEFDLQDHLEETLNALIR